MPLTQYHRFRLASVEQGKLGGHSWEKWLIFPAAHVSFERNDVLQTIPEDTKLANGEICTRLDEVLG